MKKLILTGLLATFFVAGCGSALEDSPPDSTWTVQEPDESEELTNPGAPGCEVGSEPIWSQTSQEPWYAPGRIQFSQNDGLFSAPHMWVGGSKAFRASDGARYVLPGGGNTFAIDKSWDLVTLVDHESGDVGVVRRSSGETILALDTPREDAELMATEIAASGRAVAAVSCKEGDSRLLTWDSEDGELTSLQVLEQTDGYCNRWGTSTPKLFFGPAERSLTVILGRSGQLSHLDLQTGELRQAQVEITAEGDVEPQSTRVSLLDAHIGPNGRNLLLSTIDGRVEVRRLPSLERTHEFSAGVELLNEMTYAPPVYASPVAWAPDGQRFASVSADGDVVVRDLDGEVIQTLPGQVAEPDEMWGMDDTAVALAFSHDGAKLVVGHYFGAALYACDDASFSRGDANFDSDVDLTGPTELSIEDRYEWTASVDGHRGAVLRFLLDGEMVPARSGGVLSKRFFEPGTYELAVEYDDGHSSGRATMTVTVEE